MRAALVAVVLVALAACARRDRAVESVVDVDVTPLAALSAAPAAPTVSPSREGRCTLALHASAITKSTSGCYLDTKVGKVLGTLAYPCSGNGPAVADFAEDHYVGRVEAGRVSLERTTELDWADGCRWGTRATLAGTVGLTGKPEARLAFAWTYVDHVVNGDGCSGVCRATASVEAATSAPESWRVPAEPDGESD